MSLGKNKNTALLFSPHHSSPLLCVLTSSLDSELELELLSWPHLRETTWAEVPDIRTRLEQEKDGWSEGGEMGRGL